MTNSDVGWDSARSFAARLGGRLATERVALDTADRRALAVDHVALTDLPAFDTSSMDGWAVSGDPPWQVVGRILAGAEPAALAGGTAVEIATGACVPAGATAVVRSEWGVVAEGVVSAQPTPGAEIRGRGEECSKGDVLAVAGRRVDPGVIGLLAAAGYDEVQVVRRPRARLVLFGDELLTGGLPGAGRVRDSLGPQLPSWLTRLGAASDAPEYVADTLDQHVAALRADGADFLVTTGGTAAGPVDHLSRAIEQAGGEVVIDSVAVRPGHPMMLAWVNGVPLIGLPGNPQSAVVGMVTLIEPLVRAFLGLSSAEPVPTTTREALSAPARETRLVIGRNDDGFVPASHLGSGMLRGVADSSGFAVVAPGGVPAGAEVGWLSLPR